MVIPTESDAKKKRGSETPVQKDILNQADTSVEQPDSEGKLEQQPSFSAPLELFPPAQVQVDIVLQQIIEPSLSLSPTEAMLAPQLQPQAIASPSNETFHYQTWMRLCNPLHNNTLSK